MVLGRRHSSRATPRFSGKGEPLGIEAWYRSMPEQPDHRRQAARNEAVARLMADNGYFEWAMTALFYSALHLIDAYLRTLMFTRGRMKSAVSFWADCATCGR